MRRYLLLATLFLGACHKSPPAAIGSDTTRAEILDYQVEADTSGRLVLRVKPSALTLTSHVAPVYPPQERQNLGSPIRCRATVTIGVDGRPYEVDVAECHEPFQAESQRALEKWRWEPMLWRGEPIRTRTDVVVSFARQGA